MDYNFENVYTEKPINELVIEINNKLVDVSIYHHYLNFYPEVNKFYYSVFNSEKTHSMRFFMKDNKLLFKCFSSGNSGDYYQLISQIYNLSFSQSVIKIYKELVLNNTFKQKKLPENIINNNNQFNNKTTLIEVVLKDTEPHELEYWNQYNISQETLNVYNVKSVKEVYLNKEFFKSSTKKVPIYRYLINNKYKIYCPTIENKKYKWIGNVNNECIFGLSQLNFNKDIVFITSSLKDIMSLYSINYNSVCMANSETCFINEKLIDYLKSKFKKVYLFLNGDKTGIETSIKFSKLYNLPYITTEVDTMGKDPSDYIKYNGVNKLINYINLKIQEHDTKNDNESR